MRMDVLAVGAGGVIGALLRYAIGLFAADLWHGVFPLGTLCINLAGCLLLGWLTTSLFKIIPELWQTGLGTGVIGAFTTFSTFSAETIGLARSGHYWLAAVYVLVSAGGGLFFAYIGYRLGEAGRQKKAELLYFEKEGKDGE